MVTTDYTYTPVIRVNDMDEEIYVGPEKTAIDGNFRTDGKTCKTGRLLDILRTIEDNHTPTDVGAFSYRVGSFTIEPSGIQTDKTDISLVFMYERKNGNIGKRTTKLGALLGAIRKLAQLKVDA